MSPKEWFSQGSPKVVGAVLATAVVAGLGAGAGLQLPDYLAQPIYKGRPQVILAEDPGLQKWSQVVASLGGIGATFVVPAAFYSDHSPEPEFVLDLEAQTAAATAEIDEELRMSEQRAQAMRVSWIETPPRRYDYAPIAYAEPEPMPEEAMTEADEPVPPPPPRPTEDWQP